MALKFVKGSPTTEGLYAFSSDGKIVDYYEEINSRNINRKVSSFYCYLGPIPNIQPAQILKRIFIDEILQRIIEKEPIFITDKKTGNEINWITPISIIKRGNEVFINHTYGCLTYDFWEKDE